MVPIDYKIKGGNTTATYILHVVPITTHRHDRRKSIGSKKQRKGNTLKESKEKTRKRKNEKGKERREKTRKARIDKTRRGSKERKREKIYYTSRP